MEIRSSSGPFNEHFPESHCCATPDGRGNENICPADKVKLPVVVSKRSGKGGRLNLRKSLAWNPAFFTEEGVLDSTELSIITDSVSKPSNKLLSKANMEGSSIMHFDKFSKRPPLNNLQENFWSKTRSTPGSNNKMAANLFSISEASKQDGPQMSMRKTPTRNVRKLDAACFMLEKETTAKPQLEKVTTILKLNSCPSPSNRSQREMCCSAPTGMTCLVKENAQNFRGLPPPTIQAKQSSLRMPSSNGRLESEKKAKPVIEKDPILSKLNSCPSPLTKSPMDITCSGSVGIFSSISQQTFSIPGLPPAPVQAIPSALRMPSPSLGFFQQKMVTSSHRDQLRRTSQVPTSNTASHRKSGNLKRMAPSKPPVSQTKQQSKKAHTVMKLEPFGKKGTISSSVCGRSNCISDAANEIMGNCLSVCHSMDEKTREVLLRKPHTGRTIERELTDESCSKSQISSKPLTKGSGIIEKVLHSNGFEGTSGSSQYSDGSTATEICRISSEMHLTQDLDERNLKPLYVHAPVMNDEFVMLKDAGDQTYADTSLETFQCISPVCSASEQSSLFIEPRKDSTEEGRVQNVEEYFHETRSQLQQTIPEKSQTGEVHANSYVQLAASEECQPHDDLHLCEPRNEISSLDENGLMTAENISLDNLKQDTVFFKRHLSAVPYSEEWLAAIEACGEEILEVKTGTVHNSPPGKDVLEPGPWSPVKRKAEDIGPFNCTKYTIKPFPSEE